MSKTVYLFGAGVNRIVQDHDGFRPPLNSDFVAQALRHPWTGRDHDRENLNALLGYIERYWHRSVTDLEREPFDLEACFSLLQMQRLDAQSAGHEKRVKELAEIEYRLVAWFGAYLEQFEIFGGISKILSGLATQVRNEQAVVLTFNYDTLFEAAMENAAGVNQNIPEELMRISGGEREYTTEVLAYSHSNWNRALAYGVTFDEVELQQAGVSAKIDGTRFYSVEANKLYEEPILKLHGSINWFRYTAVPMVPGVTVGAAKTGQTVLCRGSWWDTNLPFVDGWLVTPMVMTPTIVKDINEENIATQIWSRAREELERCERLVVVGYSFPPTDFHVKRLFWEAFSERSPREVAVVNPDTSVVQLVRELCNFKKSILTCNSIEGFLG